MYQTVTSPDEATITLFCYFSYFFDLIFNETFFSILCKIKRVFFSYFYSVSNSRHIAGKMYSDNQNLYFEFGLKLLI